MFYEDLTPYQYGPPDWRGENVVSIGWLGVDNEFEKAQPAQEYLTRLGQLCAKGINKMRGFHKCELCGFNPMENDEFEIEFEGYIGNGEIRVQGDRYVYAAPTLIFHYVKVHGYDAPEDFKAGVLKTGL